MNKRELALSWCLNIPQLELVLAATKGTLFYENFLEEGKQGDLCQHVLGISLPLKRALPIAMLLDAFEARIEIEKDDAHKATFEVLRDREFFKQVSDNHRFPSSDHCIQFLLSCAALRVLLEDHCENGIVLSGADSPI